MAEINSMSFTPTVTRITSNLTILTLGLLFFSKTEYWAHIYTGDAYFNTILGTNAASRTVRPGDVDLYRL